jgi:hypothetical protein
MYPQFKDLSVDWIVMHRTKKIAGRRDFLEGRILSIYPKSQEITILWGDNTLETGKFDGGFPHVNFI